MGVRIRDLVGAVAIVSLTFACGSGGAEGGGGNTDGGGNGSIDSATATADTGNAAEDGGGGGTTTDILSGGDSVSTNSDSTTADGATTDSATTDSATTDSATVDALTTDGIARSNGDAGSGAGDAGSGGGNGDAGSGQSDAGGTTAKVCTYDATKGPSGTECPTGLSCLVGVGKCSGLVIGQCAQVPAICPAVIATVCGCDGTTYNSLCDAQASGAIVKTGGTCAKPDVLCGGKYGKTCQATEICDPTCGIDGVGVCRDAPTNVCPNGGTAECGCDGKTYPNACFRQQATVGLAHQGACPTGATAVTCKIGPVKPITCASGFYCKMNVFGECSGLGKCLALPPVCDATSKPVCGCDKNTYDNACKLGQSGFSPFSLGPCK